MTPCIDEAQRLLRLAERDLQTLRILAGHPEAATSAICFHAQQCAEKALKAVLTAHCADFPRTHDLEELAALIAERRIDPPLPTAALRRLNPCAVTYRYGEEDLLSISRDEAGQMAERTLTWARRLVTGFTP